MDIWNLFEDPTFMFIFHEIICILGAIYYLPHMITRIREKKAGKEFSVSWKDHNNIVATYVVVAESLLLYEDIKTNGIIHPLLALVTQIAAIIVIGAAYILLKEDPQQNTFKSSVPNNRKKKH